MEVRQQNGKTTCQTDQKAMECISFVNAWFAIVLYHVLLQIEIYIIEGEFSDQQI